MKKVYLGLAVSTLIIPAIISTWKEWEESLNPPEYCSLVDILASPPGYRFLFSLVIAVAGLLILILLRINKDRFRNLDYSKITKRIIILGAIVFASLIAYTLLSRQCLICHRSNGTVYYPLWLSGEISDLVKETGGRYQTLHEFGRNSILTSIREMPGFTLASNVTTILFLLAYVGIFLPLSSSFGLIAFYQEAQPKKTEEESKAPSEVERTITILFLAANPRDTDQLRIDEEVRLIDEKIRLAQFRDRFDLRQQWAVRVNELSGYLLRYQPDIVHFSGHGSEASEIILEDNRGKSRPISARALSGLFSILKGNTRCVVLNACYSEPQAQAIAEYVDCVVGMSTAISDVAATSFAAAFYQALGYGKDVKTAFDLACLQIDLENLNEQDIPKLLTRTPEMQEIKFA